ncbi:MAG: DUF4012 domain-containing protein, partial [Chloroflexota bacterium]
EPPVRTSTQEAPLDHAGQETRRTASGRSWKRLVLLAFVLLLGGFVAGYLWMIGNAALRAQRTAMSASERLAELREARSADPEAFFADPLSALQNTCQEAGDLERDLRPITDLASAAGPASDMLGQVPGVGARASAMLTLASAARESSAAVRITCDAVSPLVHGAPGGGSTEALVSAFLTELQSHRAELRDASRRLRVAYRQLGDMDESVLDDAPREAMRAMREKLPSAAGRLALMAELPTMLGIDGPRSYLILGQNADELRPSGGFIGTSGVMTFDRGKLTKSEYGSSFSNALSPSVRVPPPLPLSSHMSARYWQFWESNWWPDFPSSARQAEYFHRQAGRESVDGVIAVNQEIIRTLLKVTGPIQVPDFGETVDASNVLSRMEFHVHEANYPDPVRKKFVSSVFVGVMEQVHLLPRERIGDLSAAINDGFAEQNLQMWSADSDVQAVLGGLGWDGGLISTQSDYVHVVSANLGANKVNRDVRLEASYSVVPGSDGRLQVVLAVLFRNGRQSSDPGPYKTADYLNYVRVYVPRGAELFHVEGLDSSVEHLNECGHTVFGGFLSVSPGQDRRLSLGYRLPVRIRAENYSLTVQRQSGVRPYPFEFQATELGLGARTLDLDGSQILNAHAGQLTVARAQGPGGVGSSGCEIHLAPPENLAGPAQLGIPRLGVQAPLKELGVDPDGSLQAPENGRDVGWYPQGARPGYGGNLVMSGHLDWNGAPGVFARLAELNPGDRLSVTSEDGSIHRYEVEWRRRYDASDAPMNQILGPTSDAWLTLITCGGRFDPITREYLERVVVRARLLA